MEDQPRSDLKILFDTARLLQIEINEVTVPANTYNRLVLDCGGGLYPHSTIRYNNAVVNKYECKGCCKHAR